MRRPHPPVSAWGGRPRPRRTPWSRSGGTVSSCIFGRAYRFPGGFQTEGLSPGAGAVEKPILALRMNIHSIYNLFFRLFRPGRLALFYREFDVWQETRVLDVGGGLAFWDMARRQGLAVPRVTVVNLSSPPNELPPGIAWVVGDACSLPFAGRSFDVVFSNSVVEHLGGAGKRAAFAREIHRVARGYFVQTPHRSFPVEPHLLTPFFHWLPSAARRVLLRNFTVWGALTRPSPEECASYLREVRLFNRRELKELLPASDVRVERLLLWPKSLLALWGSTRHTFAPPLGRSPAAGSKA